MITTTYGYKVPETGDSGTSLFTALEDNITRLDAHNHDGVDSPTLTAQAIVGVTQTISSGAWVANGPTGHYRQAVTVASGFDFDTVGISFRTAAGAVIYPTVERISDTQFYVYTIDNTQTWTAIYGS